MISIWKHAVTYSSHDFTCVYQPLIDTYGKHTFGKSFYRAPTEKYWGNPWAPSGPWGGQGTLLELTYARSTWQTNYRTSRAGLTNRGPLQIRATQLLFDLTLIRLWRTPAWRVTPVAYCEERPGKPWRSPRYLKNMSLKTTDWLQPPIAMYIRRVLSC